MSTPVLAASMTLDANQYLGTSSKVQNATLSIQKALQGVNLTPVQNAFSSLSKSIGTIALGLTGLGGALAAFRGAEAIESRIQGAIDAGRQLMIMSRQTGESVESLVELQKAFKAATGSADGVSTALFMMNKALGGVNEEGMPTASAFGRIGLSIDALKKMNAVQQFQAIEAGLAKLPNAADRANVASKIFGRGARDIMGLLNDPKGFNTAVAGAAEYAKTMQANAAMFEKVSLAVTALQGKLSALYANVAAGLAPALKLVLDYVNKIDFAKWGHAIGGAIKFLTEAFKQGAVGDMVYLSLRIAFEKSVNVLYGALSSLPDVLAGALQSVFNPDFMGGISQMFLGVAEAFGAALTKAVSGIIDLLSTTFEYLFAKAANSRDIIDTALKMDVQNQIVAAANKQANEAYAKGDVKGYVDAVKVGNEAQQKATALDIKGKNMADAQDMSFSEYFAKHGLDKTASNFASPMVAEQQGKADNDLKTGQGRLTAAVGPLADAIAKARDTMLSLNLFGDDIPKTVAALEAAIARVKAAIPGADQSGAPKPNQPGGMGMPALSYKMPEGDRLAKIGLFVGGSPAASGISELKRIASATEDAKKILYRIWMVPRGISDVRNTASYC